MKAKVVGLKSGEDYADKIDRVEIRIYSNGITIDRITIPVTEIIRGEGYRQGVSLGTELEIVVAVDALVNSKAV